MIRTSTLFIFALIFSSCAFKAVSPVGFAQYRGKRIHRSVHHDGITYRVKHVRNKPYAKLEFWKEALHTRMSDAGYTFIDTSTVIAGSDTGAILELAAPLGNEDYSYVIALFQKKKRIVIVESSGEVIRFQKEKHNILQAIRRLVL